MTTEDGYEEVVCTVCKEVTETVVLPALGHTSGEWVIDSEATCEADGHRHKVCTVCGENFDEEVWLTGDLEGKWRNTHQCNQ